MGLRINEIHIQNCGPIRRFSVKLGLLNLIYGHNEQGKTYLVEFILRSLFRNVKEWKLRSLQGSGKVNVAGINKTSIKFSPNAEHKLEDYFEKKDMGLPPDFSKVLVVKGAELELAGKKGELLDATILKQILSNQNLLDQIEENISVTIQECQIQNGNISGPNRKEKKERDTALNKLMDLNRLFDRIDQNYSAGKRESLLKEKKQLEKRQNELENAKRHLAFQLDREKKDIEKKIREIDKNLLDEIKLSCHTYFDKLEELKEKKNEKEQLEKRSIHYEWLKAAKNLYHQELQNVDVRGGLLFLILCFVLVIALVIFTLINIKIGVYTSLCGLLIFGYFYFRTLHQKLKKTPKSNELIQLAAEFKKRFQQDLSGIALIDELLQKMESDYNKFLVFKEQLHSEWSLLKSQKIKISEQLYLLSQKKVDSDNWQKIIAQVERQLKELEDIRENKIEELARLDVDPSDYLSEQSEIKYGRQESDHVQEKLNQIEREINEENTKLEDLKRDIFQETRNQKALNWESLIENLKEERRSVVLDYQKKTAEIIGKRIVFEVLNNFRATEKVKILEGLQSKKILDPLEMITKRYNNLRLDGERLVVSDPYHDFYLSDLSTGAQEQVLLSLRIGFATHLMGQDQMFLIFDDAFQYSDWERRERLVDQTIKLVQSGWQIIYFTMDDHIRNLFDKKANVLKQDYLKVELENAS